MDSNKILFHIMEKHGIDKVYENIYQYYHKLFNDIRFNKLRTFELSIGIKNKNLKSYKESPKIGGSIYGWREYFPNSNIFGDDIDKEILFTDNQLNPTAIREMWQQQELKEEFDIIIEDWLNNDANICFFENSIHKLKKNGYFIIENIDSNYIEKFTNKIKDWRIKYSFCSFEIVCLDHPYNINGDNNLIVIHKKADPIYKKNINIAFYVSILEPRGTQVAMYDYAFYNQKMFNNNSVIIYCNTYKGSKKEVIDNFKKHFKVYDIANLVELEKVILLEKIDILYMIKSGENDNILSKICKNVVHCVFTCLFPHADIYAGISLWVKGNAGQYVPHMINLPSTNENLREKLNIPPNAIVFGRHGGYNTFDIEYVHDTIKKIVNDDKYKNIYFLFMNTKLFYKNDNIIYLDPVVDTLEKVKFINTCDAMIHARSDGETFGLAIGEFSYCNKPIFTTYSLVDNVHLHLLKDNCYIYTSPEGLYDKLTTFAKTDKDWNMFKDYTPENVMQKFKKEFIEPLQHHFIEYKNNIKMIFIIVTKEQYQNPKIKKYVDNFINSINSINSIRIKIKCYLLFSDDSALYNKIMYSDHVFCVDYLTIDALKINARIIIININNVEKIYNCLLLEYKVIDYDEKNLNVNSNFNFYNKMFYLPLDFNEDQLTELMHCITYV